MLIEKQKAGTTQAQLSRNQQLLRDREVRKRTGVGKTKRRALILAGLFPEHIKLLNEHGLPGRTSYWLASEIDMWVEQQAAIHRANVAKVASEGLNGWLNQAVKDVGGPHHA
jgi:predicted DNA-binding transcriptional regulator AlpA